jgi:HlyD family secretion protein
MVKTMIKKLIILILLIAILAGAYYAYTLRQRQAEKNVLTLFGNVDIRQVDLGFQVSGRVSKMLFEEGDLVHPGDLVGVLDKQPYLDLMHESEASKSAIQINYENAERLLKRRQELIVTGGVAQEDLDNAQASKEALAANIKQSEAALAVAKTNLEFTEVYAPTEGTILTRIREPGTVVNIGEPIYTVSITSPVWIRAFISEPNLGQIYPNMPAEIFTDTPNGKVYKGFVGFISPVAEFTPKTVETTQLRTDLVYRLRIYAENPDRGLRQGMPVTVKLRLNPEKNSVPIQENAPQ